VSLGAIVDQVRAALVWLWRNAPELAVDVERIQVCGHSAGGHLSAMLMATHWPDLGADLPADLLHSGLAISGLYDLEPLRHTSINEAVGLNAETAARYSPALLPVRGEGPFSAAVGGLESAGFHQQAETLAQAWRSRTHPVEVLHVADTNHFTIVETLARSGPLLEHALGLLDLP
jgi:arylformamidase